MDAVDDVLAGLAIEDDVLYCRGVCEQMYGEGDLLWLEGDVKEANEAVPDKETDIKPRHYGGGKGHGYERMRAGV
jgi:hypothetical protein